MDKELILRAYRLMCLARAINDTYERNRTTTTGYNDRTFRGREAILIATGLQLLPCDFISPSYHNESLQLTINESVYTTLYQLFTNRNCTFTTIRKQNADLNNKRDGTPTIVHHSANAGIQTIAATGITHGLQYLRGIDSSLYRKGPGGEDPLVVCCIENAGMMEGKVSEAFHVAAMKKLPIVYLVQDDEQDADASATKSEVVSAYEFAAGFPGMNRLSIDGSDFSESFIAVREVIAKVRDGSGPWILHARVPRLVHHTDDSVKKSIYLSEQDQTEYVSRDPILKIERQLRLNGVSDNEMLAIVEESKETVKVDFEKIVTVAEPGSPEIEKYVFAPTSVNEERGERSPADGERVGIMDAAISAMKEIREKYPEAVFYGRETAEKPGGDKTVINRKSVDQNIFDTIGPENYIIGSGAGLTTIGIKPIIKISSTNSIYHIISQLDNNNYLTNIVMLAQINTCNAGGICIEGSNETALLSINGIKVAYPSNAADMKGLMKAAFDDPNPVVILEQEGLYRNDVAEEGTMAIEPSEDYIIPLGKGRVALEASPEKVEEGDSCCIIAYGMGVHRALNAAKNFPGRVEIIDLRSLCPLDENLIYDAVWRHGKCLVLTGEQHSNSFAEGLAGRVSGNCFQVLDAPVQVVGALDLSSVSSDVGQKKVLLSDAEKVKEAINHLLNY